MTRANGRHAEVTCESQCAEDFANTATRFAFERTSFERVDSTLPELTRLLIIGTPLSEEQQRDLVFALVVLHARNLAVRNDRGGERLGAVPDLLRAELVGVIGGLDLPTYDPAAVTQALLTRWFIAALESPDGTAFITSDNPALWFKTEDGACFLGAPLTPRNWVLLLDKTKFVARGRVEPGDVASLNHAQAFNSTEAIYSQVKLSQRELDFWLGIMAGRPHEKASYADDGFHVRFVSAPPLSFLHRVG